MVDEILVDDCVYNENNRAMFCRLWKWAMKIIYIASTLLLVMV